MEHKVYNRQL